MLSDPDRVIGVDVERSTVEAVGIVVLRASALLVGVLGAEICDDAGRFVGCAEQFPRVAG